MISQMIVPAAAEMGPDTDLTLYQFDGGGSWLGVDREGVLWACPQMGGRGADPDAPELDHLGWVEDGCDDEWIDKAIVFLLGILPDGAIIEWPYGRGL